MSDRPDVQMVEGTPTFRASSLGDCIRGLVAARLGIKPQPPRQFLRKAMDDSSLAEDLMVNMLLKRGWDVQDQQKRIEVVTEEGTIVGHLDGIVVLPDGSKRVLEMKAFGPTLFPKYSKGGIEALGQPFVRKYNMQLTAYMEATELPGLMMVYSKSNGSVLETEFDTAPMDMSELMARMATVNDFASREEYPPCDSKCGTSSWYWFVHDEEEREPIFDPQMEEKLFRLSELKNTMKQIEALHGALREEILDTLGHGKYTFSDLTATISQTMVTRVDLDKLRKDMGDDFMEAYEYQIPQQRVTVKRKKGNDAAS